MNEKLSDFRKKAVMFVKDPKVQRVFAMSLILFFMFSTGAHAEDNTWAKNGKDWILSGASYIALAFVGFFAVKYILKKQFIQFGGFAVLAAIILVIVNAPEKLKTVGEKLWSIIFGA